MQSIPRAPPLRNPHSAPGGHFEGSSLPSFLHGTLLSRATGVGAPGGDSGRGLWWLVWMSPAGVGREVCAVVFSRKSRELFVLGCFFLKGESPRQQKTPWDSCFTNLSFFEKVHIFVLTFGTLFGNDVPMPGTGFGAGEGTCISREVWICQTCRCLEKFQDPETSPRSWTMTTKPVVWCI